MRTVLQISGPSGSAMTDIPRPFVNSSGAPLTNRIAGPARRGLTMVEVLAATLLSALLMSAVLGVLKAVTGHQKAFTKGLQESWQPQLSALLEWDLSNSKTVLLTADGFELRGFAGRDLVSGMPLHCRTSIEYTVKKARDDSCLVRTETHLDAPNLDSIRSELVLSRVERIVLGESGSATLQDSKAADPEEGTPLPEQATVAVIGSDNHAEIFHHVFPLR
jgi:hypothetical protein